MNGIPDDFDPSFFVGTTMDHVGLGWYVVTLNLSMDPPKRSIAVTIEGGYDHIGPKEAWLDEVRKQPAIESHLTQLPGKDIVGALVESRHALLLSFSDGQQLRILDESDQYESFQIRHGKDFWVI